MFLELEHSRRLFLCVKRVHWIFWYLMYSAVHKSEINILDLKSSLDLEINKILGF